MSGTSAEVPDGFPDLGQRPGVWLVVAGSGTPPGCSALRRGFPVVVRGKGGTTTGYPLATLRVGLHFGRQGTRTPVSSFGGWMPISLPDAGVRGDIPAGCGTNISGVPFENDAALLLKAKLNRLRRWAGVDRPVFYLALGRAWSLISGPITMLLVTRFFTPVTQGYFYTFGSVMGLQVFFEMGFAQCIVQFASHEFAHLRLGRNGVIEGDPQARSRLISLGRLSLKWYAAMSLLAVVAIGTGGYCFFQAKHDPSVAWGWPWWCLCVSAGLSWVLLPLGALLEGCNQLAFLYGLRAFSAVVISVTVWIALASGAGLFTGTIVSVVVAVITLLAYTWRWRGLLGELSRPPAAESVSWHREIWPFQWRIAVSWISGYFAFQLFTPVLFYFHDPVVAGQMGMTLGLVGSLNALALAWVGSKAPRFGMLISQRQFNELDRLFFRSTAQAVGVCIAGGVALLLGLAFLQAYYPRFGMRVLGPGPASLLVLSTVVSQVISAQALYLRAHKREPFMWLAVVSCSVTGALVLLLGWRYGAWGACLASIVSPLLFIFWATKIWKDCRQEWHQAEAPMNSPQ